jgi:amidohydrolase
MVVSLCLIAFVTAALAQTADPKLTAEVDAVYPQLEKLYLDLHQSPELSLEEANTSAKLADIARKLGYEVTDHVGGYGIVAILKNGPGPTVMFRTDMDALPVDEKTGVAYASHVHAKDITGDTVPVMHACGHDIHMSSWIGTATIMAQTRDRWSGTLIMLAQPAEERVMGAKAMVKDGLFTRFPKPDFAIGAHDSAILPAGKVGIVAGPAMASSDSLEVTIYGKGGHGASPHTTVDPVVIAARSILAFQTLISREKDPIEPGVLTVGSIHGGTKANIIPDELKMQLSIRAFTPQVRDLLVQGVERIVRSEAASANAPRMPEVKILESTDALVNDPKLVSRLMPVLARELGQQAIAEMKPFTASEDFSEYLKPGVPGFFLNVGGVPPAKFQAANGDPAKLPSLHSSLWAPDYNPTIHTAVAAEVSVLRELLKKQ